MWTNTSWKSSTIKTVCKPSICPQLVELKWISHDLGIVCGAQLLARRHKLIHPRNPSADDAGVAQPPEPLEREHCCSYLAQRGRIKLDSLLPSERHNKPVTREMQTLSFCWKTVFTWCYFQCWKCKGLFCVFYAKQVEINITLHLALSSWTEKTYRTRNIFISEYFLEGKIKHLSQAPGLGPE